MSDEGGEGRLRGERGLLPDRERRRATVGGRERRREGRLEGECRLREIRRDRRLGRPAFDEGRFGRERWIRGRIAPLARILGRLRDLA